MEDELLEQIKQLFRESQEAIYSNGSFDAMADTAEKTGNLVPAVSQLAAAVIDSTIKDAGVMDVTVLLGLGIMIIADLLDSLQQIGIMSEEDDMLEIINVTMQQVLDGNPELAEMVASDPAMQQALQNPEQMMGAVEGQAAAGGEVAQGVLEGAEESKVGG